MAPQLARKGRSLSCAAATVLSLATGVLIAALPGTAHAAPADATPGATPSTAAPTTSSAAGVERHPGMMPTGSPDAPQASLAAGAQAATAAGVAMPTGVDVASWQHPSGGAINWSQVAATGQKFAIVKATEGDYYTNPYLQGDLNGAHAAGMTVGTYMYAIPSIDPITQADYYAAAVRSVPAPNLPPVLDIEETDGLGVSAMVDWANSFLTRLSAQTGYTPMIYTSPNFWKTNLGNSTAFGQYPLWEAHYGVSVPDPIGAWGGNYTFWQSTSQASIQGIAGNVDQDQFNNSNGNDMAALGLPVGSFDSASAAGDGTLTINGWAFDPDTPTAPGTVHVYVDGQGQAVVADGSRPDVGAVFPAAGPSHGFSATAQAGPGAHTVCVYAIDTAFANEHTTLGCRTVTVVPTLPRGMFEQAAAAADGTLTVSGWAFDPDTPTAAGAVHVYVDGQGQAVVADGSRPDVGAAFPAAGSAHGFSATAQAGPGAHTVCVYAIDTSFAFEHTTLGCRTVTVVPTLPIGMFEQAAAAGDGTLTVSGWAFDPDTPTAAGAVHVYVDGQGQAVVANGSRPDVGAAFPTAGSAHGFSATAQAGPGAHKVCVYAIDTSFANQHTTLGCRTVTVVPTLPIGMFESASAPGDGTLTVSGWAFDPDTPTTAGAVHVYVDGQGHPVVANGSRPDVGAAFPAAGPAHGFSATASAGPGAHTVCVYAIDTSFAFEHTTLGCRTVVAPGS